MSKLLKSFVTLLTLAIMSTAFAESVTDVSLEYSDFSSEYTSSTSNTPKKQLINHVKEDAMEFIATDGEEMSAVLEIVMSEVRAQNSELNIDNMALALAIIEDQITFTIQD